MYTEQQNKKAVERALETVSVRSVTTLAQTKPHILKSKGGAWHVAAMSMVPLKLVKAAVEYRNNFLESQ